VVARNCSRVFTCKGISLGPSSLAAALLGGIRRTCFVVSFTDWDGFFNALRRSGSVALQSTSIGFLVDLICSNYTLKVWVGARLPSIQHTRLPGRRSARWTATSVPSSARTNIWLGSSLPKDLSKRW